LYISKGGGLLFVSAIFLCTNTGDYRQCEARVVSQIERFLRTTLENLVLGLVPAVERSHDGPLQFSYDVRSLDHLPVDVVRELRHNPRQLSLLSLAGRKTSTGQSAAILGNKGRHGSFQMGLKICSQHIN